MLIFLCLVERRPIDPPPILEILDAETMLPPAHAQDHRFFARVTLESETGNSEDTLEFTMAEHPSSITPYPCESLLVGTRIESAHHLRSFPHSPASSPALSAAADEGGG